MPQLTLTGDVVPERPTCREGHGLYAFGGCLYCPDCNFAWACYEQDRYNAAPLWMHPDPWVPTSRTWCKWATQHPAFKAHAPPPWFDSEGS